jgi:hypothetical protein
MRTQTLFFVLFLPFFALAQPIYPDLKTNKFGIYAPAVPRRFVTFAGTASANSMSQGEQPCASES